MARSNFCRCCTSSILCLFALVLNANFGLGTSIEIFEPKFSFDGFRLNIDYQISESIIAEKVTYDIVSDKDCEGGVIVAEEITTQLEERSENSVRISMLMNPQTIHGARYVNHYDDYAIVGICARVWINKPDDTFEPVTANRDDYLLIKADLEDLEGIEEILEDKPKDWGVDVYMCNDNYVRIQNPPAIRNGEKLRLCVKPTQRTINEGVTLGTIKSFYLERDGAIQDAVATYGTDEMTNVLECERGSTLCVIETVLKNDFFFSPGEVKAEGVFFMQWGQEPERRNLRLTANMRSLYEWWEDGEIVSEKVGMTMIDVEPMDKFYKAEAFACDKDNKPSKVSPLNETDHMKICIKPDKQARDAGVYMNALESFSFALANDERSQEAIDSYGRIVAEDMTQVDCSIGDEVCSIKSTLESWFFDEDATMVASGYAILQFGADRRRAQVSLDNLAFAGRDQVEAFFDTIGRGPPKEKNNSREWFDDMFEQYDLSDTTLTILYIVAVILIILIVMCCFAGCFLFFRWGRDRGTKDEPTDRTHNIDIKINQQGKEITEFQDEREDSNSNNYNNDNYSTSEYAPMGSPRPRRNSNSEHEPMGSPRPRRNPNSEQGPFGSPRPRRGSNESEPRSPRTPKTPRSRNRRGYGEDGLQSPGLQSPGLQSPRPRNRRGSNESQKSSRSTRSHRRNSNGDDGPLSPRPRNRRGSNESQKSSRSTRSRKGSNGDEPRSPRPGTRRKASSRSRRNSNSESGE